MKKIEEITYWFLVVIKKENNGYYKAVLLENSNICAVSNDVYKAYLTLRHEIYHSASKPTFNYKRYHPASIFLYERKENEIVCLVSIEMNQYAKKNKRFRLKRKWLSFATGTRRSNYELIAQYKKQYVYPALMHKNAENYALSFLDFAHEPIQAKTEIETMTKAQSVLYNQVKYWRKNKEVVEPSMPFFEKMETKQGIVFVDVELKMYKRTRKRQKKIEGKNDGES